MSSRRESCSALAMARPSRRNRSTTLLPAQRPACARPENTDALPSSNHKDMRSLPCPPAKCMPCKGSRSFLQKPIDQILRGPSCRSHAGGPTSGLGLLHGGGEEALGRLHIGVGAAILACRGLCRQRRHHHASILRLGRHRCTCDHVQLQSRQAYFFNIVRLDVQPAGTCLSTSHAPILQNLGPASMCA